MSCATRSLSFTVPGKPVAKQRPRTVAVRDRQGRHVGMRTYTPKKTEDFERRVAWAARVALRSRQVSGPFAVSMVYYLPTQRRVDVDNLVKSVLDGLNGIVWDDDSDVVELHATKALDRGNPRTEVKINAHG